MSTVKDEKVHFIHKALEYHTVVGHYTQGQAPATPVQRGGFEGEKKKKPGGLEAASESMSA